MERAIEPRHIFFFVGSDGRRYSRQLYWESLYAFSYGGKHALVAARVVPHSSMQYALYMAFKGEHREPSVQKLLPEVFQIPPMEVYGEETGTDLVRSISALLPDLPSSVPEDMLAELEKGLEEAASRALMQSGIAGGLNAFSDPQEIQSIEEKFADPTDALHSLAESEGKDTGLVNLSFQVDAALKAQVRESMKAGVSDRALARYSDFESDVARRLYSNPRYLAFVRRVMDAKGSYISPVVRDFLSFYAGCLNVKLNEYAGEKHIDPDMLRKRLEGILGHEKGTSHYFLDYHDLTILGYVCEGNLSADPKDPDATGQNFKVDPDVDLGAIAVGEIEDNLQRFLVRQFVEHIFNRHHNVRRVQYIDEVRRGQDSSPSRLVALTDAFEERVQEFLLSLLPAEKWHQVGNRLLLLVVVIVIAVFLVGAVMIAAFVIKVSS